MRWHLQHRVMTSFKKDRGNWWVKAPKEMEVETI